MSIQLVPAPRSRSLKISEICRHLPPASIRYLATGLAPTDGDIAVAEVLECGRHDQLDLAQGRSVPLSAGDLIVVALGRHYAPLDFTGACPDTLGDCALLSAAGAAGIVSEAFSGSGPTRLRLFAHRRALHGGVFALCHAPQRIDTEGVQRRAVDAGDDQIGVLAVCGMERSMACCVFRTMTLEYFRKHFSWNGVRRWVKNSKSLPSCATTIRVRRTFS